MSKENNISQEEFELIENYLLNKMKDDQFEEFEKKIAQDEALNFKVEEIRMLIEATEASALKNKMNSFHSEITSDKVKTLNQKKNFSLQRYAIAASIAILIGLGGFWFFNNQDANQKLYSKYFKPDPGLPTVMSTTSEYDFYNAMVDYKRGNYMLAIKEWKKLLENKPQNDTLNYFIGVAFLADKNTSEAKKYLEVLLEQDESYFKKEANYYLGLTYLKEEKVKEAKKYLKLANNTQAIEILKELN